MSVLNHIHVQITSLNRFPIILHAKTQISEKRLLFFHGTDISPPQKLSIHIKQYRKCSQLSNFEATT
jgi:hypothetical protein